MKDGLRLALIGVGCAFLGWKFGFDVGIGLLFLTVGQIEWKF